jgi:hypothetical protein
MGQNIDIYIHVHPRPSMSADLRNIIREERVRLHDYIYHRKRQNQTLPDPVPMPTHLPDTAEPPGRYSVGSHTIF